MQVPEVDRCLASLDNSKEVSLVETGQIMLDSWVMLRTPTFTLSKTGKHWKVISQKAISEFILTRQTDPFNLVAYSSELDFHRTERDMSSSDSTYFSF